MQSEGCRWQYLCLVGTRRDSVGALGPCMILQYLGWEHVWISEKDMQSPEARSNGHGGVMQVS